MSRGLAFRAARLNKWLAVRLPPWIGKWMLNRAWPLRRPVLHYLEFHVADHCNLNCSGCTHFSPMADERLADPAAVERDFARLRAVFRAIRRIRIMGGEPLLNPRCAEIVGIVRAAFPSCRLELVTNALLLARQEAGFWEACRKAGAVLSVTVYPPMAGRAGELESLCRAKGVKAEFSRCTSFFARYVPGGGVDPAAAFRYCRTDLFYCPFLRDGRIYRCATGALASYWNRATGDALPEEAGLPLEEATGPQILDYLARPMATCAHCAASCRVFGWRGGEIDLRDWHWTITDAPFATNYGKISSYRGETPLKERKNDRHQEAEG